MTQVSKRYLSADIEERMYELLIKAIGRVGTKYDIVPFLSDLLYPVERIMIAKRFAIAFLLIKGKWTHREIAQALRVSAATVARINLILKIQGKGYRNIIKRLVQEEKVEAFFNKVGEIISAVPPKGRNWGQWRKEREAKIRASRKAF